MEGVDLARKNYQKLVKEHSCGAGEMAWLLRTLAVFPENPNSDQKAYNCL